MRFDFFKETDKVQGVPVFSKLVPAENYERAFEEYERAAKILGLIVVRKAYKYAW